LKLPPDNRLATLFLIGISFISGLNIYAAGFLSGMIGSKGDLKQGLLGALTAGFNAHATSYTMGYKFIKTRFHWMQYLGIKSCC
jgi:hypothetical protein